MFVLLSSSRRYLDNVPMHRNRSVLVARRSHHSPPSVPFHFISDCFVHSVTFAFSIATKLTLPGVPFLGIVFFSFGLDLGHILLLGF